LRKEDTENSDKTSLEANVQTRDKLVKEANLLEAFKRTVNTPEGETVIKWILRRTKVLDNPFTNNGHTAFSLGEQNIGREIMFKLIDTGLDLKLTDLIEEVNNNRLNYINNEIATLTQNITEENK
jgi:hypothetical protein